MSLILLGGFEPAKFTISQLGAAKALSASDLASAEYETLVKDQGLDILLPWGRLVVIQQRFQIEAKQPPFIRAADLALKALREMAPLSVVNVFGINVKAEYVYVSAEERDRLGRRLLPASSWGSWGKQVWQSQEEYPSTDLRHGGLASATLRQQKGSLPDEQSEGWIDARVDGAIPNDHGFGVFVSINDHYAGLRESGHVSDAVRTTMMLEMLEKSFDASVQRSLEIIDGIIKGE